MRAIQGCKNETSVDYRDRVRALRIAKVLVSPTQNDDNVFMLLRVYLIQMSM